MRRRSTVPRLRTVVLALLGLLISALPVLQPLAASAAGTNLAAGRTMTSSGVSQNYVASNANDGDQNTYWESANNAFPQWLGVDLGASVGVNQVVLKLPVSNWATRTQTLSVQGSTDGSNYSDIVTSTGYTFDPSTNNTVTINFTSVTTRYLRLLITANTGWPAGQISEFEVYGPSAGDTTPPTAPSGLAYTQPQSGQINLTWKASTDNVAVTGYDVYANNTLLTSVPASALTYTDTQPAGATVTYYVRAHDAAGNQSANSNSVTRTGQSGDTQAPTAPGSLAYSSPQSGQIKLTWTASTDNVGVTGYDVFRNGAKITSVSGSTLTYTDAQADTATVSYYVQAHDAAGNQSADSNTVTRTGSGGSGSNLAAGKPITGSANTYIYAPANADDNDLTTYFEGASYPSTLTVSLGANADVSAVVVKLNPDASWATRTQTIAVLGREQSATGFTTVAAAQQYTFNPSSGNSVSIPVSARISDVELSITSNSGAPGGQVAEFQVIGTPAPNPDLTITGSSWTPSAPVETDPVTVSATVKNIGTAAAPASSVNFYRGTTKVGTAAVGALAVGASSAVTAAIGTQTAGTYQLTAKVDEANTVIELNDGNNSYTNPSNLVVAPVQSSDLIASPVAWTPSNPAAGNTVNFSVTLKNQGTVATAGGGHAITLALKDSTGATVKTLTGTYTGTLAPGASGSPVAMGSWTAVNGKYTAHTTIAVDANELSVKQANNVSDTPLFVGRGANMPYDVYQAEDGQLGGGAQVVGPNRTIGDLAGEASGREAVTLDSTGSSVQWTTRASTNTLVTRFSIPDSSDGAGANATLDVYVNGTFLQAISLTSKYSWLYGDETSPSNTPSAGSPRHIYDEANAVLNETVPAGSVIKLQKDAANTSQYAIDYINTEQVAPVADPDPATYVTPAGFGQQDVQNALDQVRMDTTGKLVGVYLPAGQYQTSSKFQVSGKAVKVVGAGPWFTQFNAPSTESDTDVGFSIQSSANGSSFTGFGWFGNYTSRIDGPGKVFDLTDVSNITVDNVWIEHQVCAIWGTHVTGLTATNMRIRDTFADGINLTNGSQNNLVSNDEARSTGDDSFALFAAQDHNNSDLTGNTFQNLTALTPWRAAGVAVYGGDGNTVQNIYVADTLTYSGLTISSLNFGYPFQGFGASPQTVIQNVSLVRDGGHFWGGQVFGAVWCFSATQPFQGIRVNDLDITDPTYSGIMFQTDYSGSTALNPVTDTVFTDTSITGAQQSGDAYNAKSGYGIWANPLPEAGQGPAVGSATFKGLTESNNHVDIENTTSTFTVNVTQ
ncbi:discoidin domain-containing protein [Streptomyces sp. SL13]|uniref:Discoidin domain-containing protein n=1 Tax=Streptantibioticus silvisoli TaxID=2705255 RepID=A0AA90H3V6_9ACTN|nr:discoidin domain-containing protein [Streptantibioticus silvisoli]MDI5970816.1 discoidin domain-containing protein [Streptantibioticus silvisoli]